MNKKTKKPCAVYSKCPACGSSDLLRLAVDVLCCSCDWMSVAGFVEAGGMDNLISAYNDHFRANRHFKDKKLTGSTDLPDSHAVQDNLSA